MARFLFTTWEGGGHVQPLLLAAQEAMQAGHEVLVISDQCNSTDADFVGVPFRPWTRAPSQTGKTREEDRLKDHEAESPLDIIHRLLDRLMTGPALAYALDTLEAIDAFQADIVISQELLFGAMAAAEARKLPLAVFAANIWSLPTLQGVPPFGAGMQQATNDEERAMHDMVTQMSRSFFQAGLPALNAAREGLALAPLTDLFDQLNHAGRILLATSQTFDFAPDVVPEPFVYVGPYMSDPAWAPTIAPPTGDAPLVLVSFSSLYQAQEAVLGRIIEALGRLPVTAVVTTGPTLSPNEFTAPANVSIVRAAAHSELLPKAALFVTHAGHGSTLRPLMAGVPLLCLPLGRDQHDNAARVASRSAGLSCSATASVEDLAATISTMLETPDFRSAAGRLGQAILSDAANRSARQAIESLL
jgi:MGT family glycosyltransferase